MLEFFLILTELNNSHVLTVTRSYLYRFDVTKPMCYSLSSLLDVSSIYRFKKLQNTLDICSAVVHRLVLMLCFNTHSGNGPAINSWS